MHDTGGSYILHPDGRRELREQPTQAGSGPRLADGTPIGADGTPAMLALAAAPRRVARPSRAARRRAVREALDAAPEATVVEAPPAAPTPSKEA